MLKLLIFGYSNGVTSSRALERLCHHDVAFMFLTAQAAPDFVAISRFRKRHLKVVGPVRADGDHVRQHGQPGGQVRGHPGVVETAEFLRDHEQHRLGEPAT